MGRNTLKTECERLKYYHNRDDGKRYWCFKGQFKDKEPFYFGSVVLPLNSSFAEVLAEGKVCWDKIMPIDVPESWEPVPGIIIFQKEEDTA